MHGIHRGRVRGPLYLEASTATIAALALAPKTRSTASSASGQLPPSSAAAGPRVVAPPASAAEAGVAVISIDPPRDRTGSALLGDRIRMNALDPRRVFVRSLATRKQKGERSGAVREAVAVCKGPARCAQEQRRPPARSQMIAEHPRVQRQRSQSQSQHNMRMLHGQAAGGQAAHDTRQEIADMQLQGWTAQQASFETSHRQVIEGIREGTRYDALDLPGGPANVEASPYFGHVWSDTSGICSAATARSTSPRTGAS